MANTPYPLPREIRESTIQVGNGTAGPYGPSQYRVFDVEDVKVYLREIGEPFFQDVTSNCVIAKTTGEPYDTFSVTFWEDVPATGEWYHSAKRVGERSIAVTRAGTLVSDQLEKELSKFESTVSEIRRDLGRTLQVEPGQPTPLVQPLPDGHFYMSDNGRLVDGGTVEDIQNAQENAASAREDAERAEAARNEASLYDPTFRFKSVADLLSSTRAGGGNGTIWQAAGFLYQEVDPASVNYHVETAGGVRLFVLPGEIDRDIRAVGTDGHGAATYGFAPVDISSGLYDDLIAVDADNVDIVPLDANPDLAYLRQRKYGDMVKSSEFGQDLAVALAVAGERAKLFGLQHRADVYVNHAGTLALSRGLVVPTGVNLISDKNLVLDAAGISILNTINLATGVSGAGGGVIIDMRPEAKTSLTGHYSEPLPAWQPIAVGDIEVAFDEDIALKEGEVLVWYDTIDGSWSSIRPEYRLSMRRRITGVDGRKIYIDKPARDAFVSSPTLKVRKQSMMTGRFGGFKLDLGSSNHPASFGVVMTGLDERSEVSDIVVEAATYGGIAFNQCRNIRPQRLRGGTVLGAGTTSVYPINILNSTDVRIRDSEGSGDWHSLAMGGVGGANLSPGATINEDCWYDSCKAYNSGYTAVPAIEMHGNSDRCGFLNCEAAAAVMAGRDPSLINGRLDNAQTKAAQNTGRLIFFVEAHSGRFHVQGTTMRSVHNSGLSSLGGAIYYSSEAVPAKGEVFIDIEGVSFDAPYEVQPVRIGNSLAGSDKVSFSFDGSVNLPAATRFATVVNGNTDVQSSYFRLERVAGLKPGTSWAVWLATGTAGAMTFAETKFPAQRYVLDTAGVAAASELLPSGGTQALRYPFPVGYQPTAMASLLSNSLGLKASARIASLTTSAFRAQVATDDGTNYSAAIARVAVVVE